MVDGVPFWPGQHSIISIFCLCITLQLYTLFVFLGKKKPIRVLLEWPAVHSKFPWSIMFLMGGGYALANASKVSNYHTFI